MPYKDKEKARENMRKNYLKNRDKQIKRAKERRAANPFEIDTKNILSKFAKRSGIPLTYEEYMELYIKSGGICQICGKQNRLNKRRLAVDHDHKTNKVRGFLCDKCNRGLGFFDDDTDKLNMAIIYLIHNREKNKIK